jgi:hypothetical protein
MIIFLGNSVFEKDLAVSNGIANASATTIVPF